MDKSLKRIWVVLTGVTAVLAVALVILLSTVSDYEKRISGLEKKLEENTKIIKEKIDGLDNDLKSARSNIGSIDSRLSQVIEQEKKHFEKGIRLYNIGSYDQALSEFKLALDANPNSADALFHSGVSYYRKYMARHENEFLDRAGEYFKRVTSIDPKYAKSVGDEILGRYFQRNGFYRLAVNEYLKSAGSMKKDSDELANIYFEVGNCFLTLKNKNSAEKYFRKIISEFPNTEPAKKSEVILNNVLGS